MAVTAALVFLALLAAVLALVGWQREKRRNDVAQETIRALKADNRRFRDREMARERAAFHARRGGGDAA